MSKVHASLFTGIGGFDLAAEWMGWNNLFQCEIDPYCNKLLTQNFPNTIKHGNIKETDFNIYRGSVDVLSGGFPCQPYSTAGKRLGKEDERHLWPEMLRAIREIQPPWIVGENVRGLTNWNGGLVFDEVQADLEAAGYEVTPFLLPAAGVNAPHRRDRIFFIAYSASFRRNRELYQREGIQRGEQVFGKTGTSYNAPASDTRCEPSDWRESIQPGQGINNREDGGREETSNVDQRLYKERIHTDAPGGRGQQTDGERESEQPNENGPFPDWKDFPTQPGVCRGNDGIPNRVDRIKGLGNAVVPQVVLQIFKAIEAYEQQQ